MTKEDVLRVIIYLKEKYDKLLFYHINKEDFLADMDELFEICDKDD